MLPIIFHLNFEPDPCHPLHLGHSSARTERVDCNAGAPIKRGESVVLNPSCLEFAVLGWFNAHVRGICILLFSFVRLAPKLTVAHSTFVDRPEMLFI